MDWAKPNALEMILPFWFHVATYDPMVTIKHVRVVMAGTMNDSFRNGIYRYGFFTKTEVV